MDRVEALSDFVGEKAACEALNIPRASWYRYQGKQENSESEDLSRSTLVVMSHHFEDGLYPHQRVIIRE